MERYAQLSNNVVINAIESETNPDGINGEWVACGDAGPGWLYDGETFAPPASVTPPIPSAVTRKQARKALALAGLFDAVQPAIDAIADPLERRLAQIDWDDAQEYERSNPFLNAMATALALDDAALDALFVTAAAL